MRGGDFLRLTGSSLIAHRMRSFLTTLGIAVGIAAVVLLTSIGEGVHQFVLSEFSQFGTNLVGINPGKATTAGTSMGMFGTERPLSIADAQALERLSFTEAVVPVVAVTGEGLTALKQEIQGVLDGAHRGGFQMTHEDSVEQAITDLEPALDRAAAPINSRWLALKLLEGDPAALALAETAGRDPLAVTDAHFAALKAHYSDDAIVEIVSVIALLGWIVDISYPLGRALSIASTWNG